jgi:hypothetical protein
MTSSRRVFLSSAGLIGLGVVGAAYAETPDVDAAWLQARLERYAGFGVKASGGDGDNACGAWLETELSGYGFNCRRQHFDIPFFEVRRAVIASGGAQASVIPQAIVKTTGANGLSARLRIARPGVDLAGAIAVIDLPYKRWAALADPQVARPLADAFGRGAAAAILITTGPTKDAIALNVSTHKPPFDKPVAILAPKDAQPFLDAAVNGQMGSLIIDGQGGIRSAFNVIARLERGAPKDLILSTPRSGWFDCAAERGSGLVVWLSLAQWLARSNHSVNLELLVTSGHEYEYLGGEHYLAQAPAPAKTKLWTHIGASAAARDWLELGGKLSPLPSADSQRVLTATADIVGPVRTAFKGITGLEATFVASRATAGGELVNVLDAGYKTMIGLYGGHRYFHTQDDDLRCVSGDLVQPVAAAFRAALTQCLA